MRTARTNKSKSNISALEHGSKFLDSRACQSIESAAPQVLRSEIYLKNKLNILKTENRIAQTHATNVGVELEAVRSQQRAFAIERGRIPYDRGRFAQNFYEQNPELYQRKDNLTKIRKETNIQAQRSAAALAEAEEQITNLFHF
jgi:hypothetical protein